MLHLYYIFEFVIDGFDNGSFSEKQPVRDGHQRSFYIAFQLGYKLYSVNAYSCLIPSFVLSILSIHFPDVVH